MMYNRHIFIRQVLYITEATMVVNFDFLDNEPIENVITNLNFQIDKTVYFGYSDSIGKYKKTLELFLAKYCGGQEAEFIPVPKGKLGETLAIMRDAVLTEINRNNEVFFDITGGEAIPLVAFGILSTETDTPIHVFNVNSNKLLEQEDGADREISRAVPRRNTEFTVEMLVELRGGAVKTTAMKQYKDPDNNDPVSAEEIISLFRKHTADWSRLISAMHNCLADCGEGVFRIDYDKASDHYHPSFVRRFRNFIQELHDCGMIKTVSNDKADDWFWFADDFVKANLTEEGAALEIMTCMELRKKYGQAQAGVVIDWDGAVDAGHDVVNEIDVIALDGFVPVIVSCKCGNQANKDAIYELETVARKFGGKYARKMLMSVKNMTPADKDRAAEMGIEVRILNEDVRVKNYNNH